MGAVLGIGLVNHQRQLESDETDRSGLGYHPARRLAVVGALLFRPANGLWLKRFAASWDLMNFLYG